MILQAMGDEIKKAKLKTSRVGGGKSIEELKLLARKYHQILGGAAGTTIFASLTRVLSAQSYTYFRETLGNPNCLIIDGDHCGASTAESLAIAISSGFDGVIFVTHKAMASLSSEQLNSVDLVIDEMPTQDLIRKVSLYYEDNPDTNPRFMSEWVTYEDTGDSEYKSAKIKPEFVEAAKAKVASIQDGNDNAYTKTIADILSFLIREEDVLYKAVVAKTEGGITRCYHDYKAYDTMPLKRIMEAPRSITILSANCEDNILTYTATASGYTFEVETTLEQKHKHKAIVVPFLKSGNWSGTLRDSLASDSLVLEDIYTGFTGKCSELIQRFTIDVMGNENLLLFKNKDVPAIEELKNKTNFISTNYVHGLNSYRDRTKASYTASSRLNGWQERVLKLFAEDKGLDPVEMSRKYLVEKNYEACYQCLGRTHIRTTYIEGDETVCVFVVPDLDYANYIQNKFEEGCCIIDTTRSLVSITSKKREEKKDARLEAVINVLIAKRNNKGKKKADRQDIDAILKANALSSASFSRYKKEFKDDLKGLGLI